MEKNILRRLFDGEIYPAENIKPDTPEYNETLEALEKEKEYFSKYLTGADAERFKKANDLYFEIIDIYGYECFAHGFRLGVTLLHEALSNKDDLARNEENKKGDE